MQRYPGIRHIIFIFLLSNLMATNETTKLDPVRSTPDFTSFLYDSVFDYGKTMNLPTLARLHFEMGATYANEGQYELAIDAFKSALREHPDFLGARLAIDKCYQLKDGFPRLDFTKLETSSDNPESENHFIRAKQEIVNNDIKAAIVEFEKSLALDPVHLRAQYNLWIAYYVTGDTNSAIQGYKKSVELYPNNYLAWETLGVALAVQDNKDEAQTCFKKAVTINPGLASAYHSLGVIYKMWGEHEVALSYFKLAVALNPKNDLYREHLGVVLAD